MDWANANLKIPGIQAAHHIQQPQRIIYLPPLTSLWGGISINFISIFYFLFTMENILQGINLVCVYVDDILVINTTTQEHLQNLDEVLRYQHKGYSQWVTRFRQLEMPLFH